MINKSVDIEKGGLYLAVNGEKYLGLSVLPDENTFVGLKTVLEKSPRIEYTPITILNPTTLKNTVVYVSPQHYAFYKFDQLKVTLKMCSVDEEILNDINSKIKLIKF